MKHIVEAKRYIHNAKEILSEKAQKEDRYYQDSKYVKMAGHTAYSGVLLALDALFQRKQKGRKDVDWYKENITKQDKKMLQAFVSVYNTLHLSLGYDGNPSVKVAQDGLETAEYIIRWVEQRVNIYE